MLKIKQSGRISIICVSMVLGFMIAVQFRATEDLRSSVANQRVETLVERLLQTEDERDRLQEELKAMKEKERDGQAPAMDPEILMKGGFTPLVGTGVTVTLDDSKATSKAGENPNLYIIHDDDILRVINELRAAGAEAVSINGQRLVGTSEIRCAGPTLSVNNVRSAAPFVIKAIGNSEDLEKSIKMRGGVEDTLKVWGIRVSVEKEKEVNIPAYTGAAAFKYAKQGKEEASS
ncbi:DUF881 domain-containing protein [Selenomonas sp. TAMA-11512]|uniref:DUF881 domain-containing protein n=1 Tax=Selenomonas sp. TAMA-11512 TaxID=3095337 RepID=UPI00308C35CA|nr:DUF881 domain-containing protein [Selenomonas sp. TAMA-11512]